MGNMLRSVQISTGGRAANQVNPFRYRGYYYDTETGLYYLQSRYYNPQWGRFLNADYAEVISDNGTITDKNLFVYCENNPVMRADADGEFAYRSGRCHRCCCWEAFPVSFLRQLPERISTGRR